MHEMDRCAEKMRFFNWNLSSHIFQIRRMEYNALQRRKLVFKISEIAIDADNKRGARRHHTSAGTHCIAGDNRE